MDRDRYERLGVDPWLTPEDEERDRRIFHLHDDPADCDEPEIHFGDVEGGEAST
jgi:hypothetical protein